MDLFKSKKAQTIVGEVIGVVVILIVIVGGSISAIRHNYQENEENQNLPEIYIGDKGNNNLYSYNKCKNAINQISPENIEVFYSLKEAQNKKYELVEWCV